MKRFWLTLLLVLAAALTACGVESGALTIPVTISESQLNQFLQAASDAGATADTRLLDSIERTEFIEPDTVRWYGTHTTDTGQTVQGSVDMRFGTANGELDVQVTDVNIAGMNANSEQVQRINQEMENALSQAGRPEQEVARVLSASVVDNQLEIVFAIQMQQQ
jgi:predicted small lipoprotein YifL